MSDGFAYIDILFFAMVAAFIAYRLRSVLGRRTGLERHPTERRDRDPVSRTGEKLAEPDNVIPLPERSGRPVDLITTAPQADPAEGSRQAADGLGAIRSADSRFDPTMFASGAKSAFGMVVNAFASGDLAALRPLLADQVFGNFKAAIEQRTAAGERLETEIVEEPKAELVSGSLHGRLATVVVRFVSSQINVTRDAQGTVISGDPVRPEEVVDLWTFERDVGSSDPNWVLAETATPE